MADFTADFVVEDDEPDMSVGPADASPSPAPLPADTPDTLHRLAQRQKQVDFGKNTLGYQRYAELVPRHKRTARDPATPDIHQNISKRCFDGQVKAWRRQLHLYDNGAAPPARSITAESRGGGRHGGGGGQGWRSAQDARSDDAAESGQENAVPGGADGSPVSQGSMDAYLDPNYHANRKRVYQCAFVEAGGADAAAVSGTAGVVPATGGCAGISSDPLPKRAAGSAPVSMGGDTFSGAAAVAPGAPTSFTGLAAKLNAAAVGGGAQGVHVPAPAPLPKPRIAPEDNIIAMLLGPEHCSNSCMSVDDGARHG